MPNTDLEEKGKLPLRFITQDPFEARIYANHIRVAFSDKDFQIEFADEVTAEMTDDDGEKFGAAVVRSRIVLSPKLIPRFIEILDKSYRRYCEHENEPTKD